MIEARGLCKRFRDKKRGEIHAVENVSFTCQPGRVYGLLGANGAGKTTTLRMLATILEPSDGTAAVAGYDIVAQPEKVRASVGFLSTATALYPRLTAQEMVEYFGRLNGLDEVTLQRRVAEIFARLEMDSFRERRCDKLSTGMKQKVSIARTLVHDPPVMIFDEPTLGLDVMTARTILAFIRECRDRGKTVIFST
ncbi:MAG: ATP-binding cassette domain-containing protein, partial [Acidobacteriia bacterium]|nr:ATP-binding cassette domain-containing protein [Terriglobia bacterium]